MHKLIKEGTVRSGLTQGIEYEGWTIISKKSPICNSTEMDNLQKDLGLPPPEMVFGNNTVTISKNNQTILTFNARDALALVEHSDNNIKVAYAAEWARNSTRSDVKDVVKPYDWTYSTTYKGTGDGFQDAEQPAVDVHRLQKQEPILFYDEVILYEDELADNGTTLVSIRLRVMPSCFLVLLRMFLRVDNVVFRINDTRIYHEFGSPYVVREYTSREDRFQTVFNKLPAAKSDVSLLGDPNWVASKLPPPTTFTRERLSL
ncbi:TIP41-like family-domain-containing protein [Zychaea mexicana]|uniref:TIP41-like family-domain-containing protein n=1 Tax=Zychaea mexicana TaxID=64656 RepID=UPI0022FE68BA|nr:TIP41-like family-domain-containing protein [Zychaea mexicana]KAI9499148.1 TIP41-like family-domain-containing protein [Zychaea mexicana]